MSSKTAIIVGACVAAAAGLGYLFYKKTRVSTPGQSPLSHPQTGSLSGVNYTVVPAGTVLKSGAKIGSPSGAYYLEFQSDGNLVMYSKANSAVWASGTSGSNADSATMQSDGNLVIYQGTSAKWAAGTAGHGGAFLAVQDDGNLVIYQATSAIWASKNQGGSNPFGFFSEALNWVEGATNTVVGLAGDAGNIASVVQPFLPQGDSGGGGG